MSGHEAGKRAAPAGDMHVAGVAFLVLAAALLIWQAVPAGRFALDTAFFLPFHIVVEMFAAVVAAMVFITGWHIHDKKRPAASMVLACAFLAVAVLDFLHAMSYPGMADFITRNTPGKATVFWLAAQYAAAFALLAFVLMPYRRMGGAPRRGWLAASLLYVLLAGYVGMWHADWLTDGVRGAPFTAGLVAGAVAANLVTLGLLLWRRHEFNRLCHHALIYAAAFLLASEAFFMLHPQAASMANALSHAYKALAYLFLYRAIFQNSVLAPIERFRRARAEMAEIERRHRELLETAPDAIMVVDAQGHIQMVNGRLEQMFGYARTELLGQKMEMLVPDRHRAQHHVHRQNFIQAPSVRAMTSKLDLVGRHKNGSEVPVDIALSTFQSDAGIQVTAFIRDMSERRRMEADFLHQATHDALTGLPNRTLFQDRLVQTMIQARRHDRLMALIMLGLDNFKVINDGLGHHYGDLLLTEAAHRLTAVLRPDDTVARLGGDEFALLLNDLGHVEDVGQVADKVLQAFSRPFRVGDNEVFASASLGVTVFPVDGGDVTTLLRNAGVAMNRAKAEGRGCMRLYTQDLNTLIRENLLLQTCLRRAVEEGQFQLHYQPQIEMASHRICGVEALLRWSHEELGEVSPARFIPVAEASGLIVPIGTWAIHAACRQIKVWQDAGLPTKVAVNLSAHQFRHGNLVGVVKAALAESGASPGLLELELTESALMGEPMAAAQALEELEELGITIAIDDFGTGYSSLAYLKMFSLHKLKIDRSFVKDVAHDADDVAIVRGLVGLAHSLELRVIAEGVETEAQRAVLAGLGCNGFQGWLYSRAVPGEECGRMLAGEVRARYGWPGAGG